ncbi:MAG: hypothetical protein A2901_02815 [Elusimicrobia bacterium RIFCSPLOWO2_01_FULL_54_10]|nr:MAG: hypothetical protein A2901_02815 [Elusimicrobia bacterium RIFCSPLOWO2_01_FULL_54_10]
MIEQRNQYYSIVDDLLDKNNSLKDLHEKMTHRWNVPYFETITPESVLDRMRNYVIGVYVSDEQVQLTAIAEMNPKKFDFVPGPKMYYGALFYYPAAAFIALGKITGLLSLTPGVEYYFTHPDEIRNMYMLVRSMGGVSVVLAVLLIGFLAVRFYGEGFGLLSAAFLATFPLSVSLTHLAKSHILGMFWIVLSLGLVARILKCERPGEGLLKEFSFLAVALGCCAGVIFTNLILGAAIFFTEWAAQDWRLSPVFKSRRFWASSALFFLVSAVLNFHFLLQWSEFQRYVQSMFIYFPAFHELQLNEWPAYVKDVFTEHVSLPVLPFLVSGIFFAFKKKEKFMLVCVGVFLILFAQNLVTTRHTPVNARLLPLIAVLSAWGVLGLWGALTRTFGRAILSLFVAGALGVAAVQCAYYWWLHRSPSRLDIAGEWINQNVPKGESLGAWGGSFAPVEFPAIRFLDYKIISIPHSYELDSTAIPIKKMPRFLVVAKGYSPGLAVRYPESRYLAEHYRDVVVWKDADRTLERFFGTLWINAGNMSVVKVMEKKPGI